MKWHTATIGETAQKLKTDAGTGLTETEANRRLREHGPNKIEEEEESLLESILEPFKEPMMLLLILTGIIYSLFGEPSDAIAIFAIIAVIGGVEVYQERRAEKSINALKELTTPLVDVVRDGTGKRIESTSLVPGDLVILETGNRLSADLRLVQSVNLRMEESALTGESVPVDKEAEPVLGPEAILGDRRNMGFTGTTVVHGRGSGIVVATAMETEMGHIAGLMKGVEEQPTPLQRRMKALTGWFAIGSLSVCAAVVVSGVIKGEPFVEMLLYGLSLAVSTIPEDLPIILTIILVLSVRRMARQKALVKKLYSVETLSSTSVICSDKTGTLTQNRMSVDSIHFDDTTVKWSASKTSDQALLFALKVSALCNDARLDLKPEGGYEVTGDPTEKALIVAALEAGIDLGKVREHEPLIGEYSFDNQRKMMSTIRRVGDTVRVYSKGAPEAILARCTRLKMGSSLKDIGEEEKARLLEANSGLAEKGLRVLAMAYKEMEPGATLSQSEAERNLVFIAYVGLVDPPREEVRPAIKECHDAGIRTIMITGDHRLTAVAIAKTLQLSETPNVMTGLELDALQGSHSDARIAETDVFARVTPEHKLRIVKALKGRGEVVAMTGDGVNDAPALREADVGIAMGETGTDVAREAAAMVLADDNFATIVQAVKEGRRVFDNLRKAITYYISTKIAVLGIALASVALGLPFPLLPIQIILMEVLTDVVASTSFESESPESDLMQRPPSKLEGFVSTSGQKLLIGFQGISIVVGVLLLYSLILSYGSIEQARTAAFATTLFSIVFLAFNSRSETQHLFGRGLLKNRNMALTGFASLAIAALVIETPMLQVVFKTASLSLMEWIMVLAVSLLSSSWLEVRKIFRNL